MYGNMMTPRRPFKRQLVFTPASSIKRSRTSGPPAVRGFRTTNKHYGRGPSKTGSLLAQVKALQRFVGTLKPEIKYLDVDIAAVNVTGAGAVVSLVPVSQGDTVSTRTGNSINVVSINLRATILSFSTTTRFHYRVLVVQDKQQIGDTLPTASDIISDGVVASASPLDMLPNIANLDRFNILYASPLKQALMMNSNFVDTTYTFSKKVNIKTSFNGTAGTDIQKNGLYVVYLTEDSGGILDFTGVSRIGFTDV